jgi:subtilisin
LASKDRQGAFVRGIKLLVALATLITCSTGLAFAAPNPQPASDNTQVPGAYIVVLKASTEHPGSIAAAQAKQQGGTLGFVYHSVLKGYSVKGLSNADADALRRNPQVKYIEPEHRFEATEQTLPTGISRIFAPTNPALAINGIDDTRVNPDRS